MKSEIPKSSWYKHSNALKVACIDSWGLRTQRNKLSAPARHQWVAYRRHNSHYCGYCDVYGVANPSACDVHYNSSAESFGTSVTSHSLYRPTLRHKVGNQYAKVGNQYSEVGNQYSEVGNQYAEVGNQYAEVGNQYAEAGNQYAEVGNQYAEVGNQYAEVGNQYAEVGNQYAEVGNQYAEVGNQYAEVSNQYTILGSMYLIVASHKRAFQNYTGIQYILYHNIHHNIQYHDIIYINK